MVQDLLSSIPPLDNWRACALAARALLSRLPLGPAELTELQRIGAAMDALLAREPAPAPVAWPAAEPPAPVARPAAEPPAPVARPAAEPVATATAFTFGENEKGALGQGFQRPPNWEPARQVSLPAGASLAAVAAGSGCTAFLTSDGGCYLAGTNASYLHGDTQARGRDVPTQIPLLAGRRVSRLFLTGTSTHAFACVDGRLHAWGRLSVALGLGRSAITVEPTAVEQLGTARHEGGVAEALVRQVAVGLGHSWLVLTSGELFGSGSNSRGQLGMGMRNSPYDVNRFERPDEVGAVRFVAAACGVLHSACVSDHGGLYVAGNNEMGQLGLGGKEDRFRLTRVEQGSVASGKVVAVACGAECTYCITEDGRVHAAGSSRFGQLGVGAAPASDLFVALSLPDGRRAAQIVAGERHALLLCDDGALFAWGENYHGQVTPGAKGDAVREPKLLPPLGPGRVYAIAAGRAHNVVLVA